MTEDEIQENLDALTARFASTNALVSVDFIPDRGFVCVFRDLSGITDRVSSVSVTLPDGSSERVLVEMRKGPALATTIGEVGVDPVAQSADSGTQGGDECRNSLNMGYFGTITLYLKSAELDVSGKCNSNCVTAPAMLGNNHVLARSDGAGAGEAIWTQQDAEVAALNCFVPLRCDGNVDIAAARVRNINTVQQWTVRGVGVLAGVRRPNVGEPIRKHGARTGLTAGTVTGRSNILVDGHYYYGVFQTSPGFGCPGDSGSAVIGANGDLLGIYSWGQTVACQDKPVGYFFPILDPGSRSILDRAVISIRK